ncbi:MAG: hypothetical protein LBR73_08950 [Oscillospiraceae bacterium]|jgi:hypothetical protein|nr:hypothetical protein [Oscillospiraceae bacterium]
MALDPKTMAYINMFGVMGAMENLCELDASARALLTNKKPIRLCFDVKDGPKATFTFANGRVRVDPGVHKCDVKIPLGSPQKFNDVVDGKATPIPVKGFQHIGFLTKDFDKLSKKLESYLRPTEEDLADPEFFEISTTLTLYVLGTALAQVADYDEIGKFSAHLIPDGDIGFSVKDGPAVTIHFKNHVAAAEKTRAVKPRAIMEFESIELARALFDGKVNALACIGNGSITMRGMINMIDNLNRVMDRAALYLS